MDVTKNDTLPLASANGSYWIPKTTRVHGDDDVEERVLRPNWDRSWGDNKAGWVLDVIHIIRRDASEYTHTKLDGLTQRELQDGLEVVWGGLQKRWALQQSTQKSKDEKAEINKIKGRKVQVRVLLVGRTQATHSIVNVEGKPPMEVRAEGLRAGASPAALQICLPVALHVHRRVGLRNGAGSESVRHRPRN